MAGSAEDIHVLQVDDEPAVAEMTAAHLERQEPGMQVTTAIRSGDALDYLDETHVDCVVSDYDMPDMDGIELLNAVRADNPDIPFILYTGKGSEEVASEAISAGVSDYLQKEVGTSQYELLANRIVNAVTTRRAQERAATYLDAVPHAVLVVNAAGEITRANPQVETVFGHEPAALTGEHVGTLFRDGFWTAIVDDEGRGSEASPSTGAVYDQTGVRTDGTTFDADVNLKEVSVGAGDIVVSVRDVTRFKQRERELEQYERIIDHAPVGMFRLDEEFRIVYENPRAEEIIGLPEDAEESDALGVDVRELPPIVEAGVDETIGRLVEGERLSLDFEFTSIYGTESHLRGYGVPLLHEGEFDGAVLLIDDVSEEKARERALENERDRLRALFHNNSQAIARYEFEEGDALVREVNPAFERVFDCDAAAVRGRSLKDLVVPPRYEDEGRDLERRVRAGEIVDVDVVRKTADGLRPFNLRSVPLDSGPGSVEGYAIYTDLTSSERTDQPGNRDASAEAAAAPPAEDQHRDQYRDEPDA